MAIQVDEKQIRQNVLLRLENDLEMLEDIIQVDRYTPGGNLRSAPIYVINVMNLSLGKSKSLKGKDPHEVMQKASSQLETWAEQEIKSLVTAAKRDAKEAAQAEATDCSEAAREYQLRLQGILEATLDFDDKIDWKELEDHKPMREFYFPSCPEKGPAPARPIMPSKPFLSLIIPAIKRKWEEGCTCLNNEYLRKLERFEQSYSEDVKMWQAEKDGAEKYYQSKKQEYIEQQDRHNQSVQDYRKRFEAGDPDAVLEYVNAVFERSNYPDEIELSYDVHFDPPAQTLVVEVMLPNQDSISDIIDYKYIPSTNSSKPVQMKKKEHDCLYDSIIKQIVLRTIHEVFESVYTTHVMSVVVNGWIDYIDKATGNEQTSCIISVAADREQFESFNLARIDCSECIKALKGLTAGPLSDVAPVKPILQLDTNDARLIESREVLANINSTTNLAEIPWEDFEHLVRDLFEKMFSGAGVEVRVTQASRDQGVDAIVFDPDPIRGGKYVIQAKRYTATVGVGAVRELYGTMINEGAVKGILVTTATYGRDSRSFVKDKPITLIDGSNLVYLLEQHGHKVRIDVAAARAKM